MSALVIGRRAGAFERARLLLFDDRLELLGSGGLFGWDVRRMFFDELECATVCPRVQWGTVILSAFAALWTFVTAALVLASVALLAALLAVLGVGLVALAVRHVVAPTHRLIVRAPGQAFDALLPRAAAERERVLEALRSAIDAHQARHAEGAR